MYPFSSPFYTLTFQLFVSSICPLLYPNLSSFCTLVNPRFVPFFVPFLHPHPFNFLYPQFVHCYTLIYPLFCTLIYPLFINFFLHFVRLVHFLCTLICPFLVLKCIPFYTLICSFHFTCSFFTTFYSFDFHFHMTHLFLYFSKCFMFSFFSIFFCLEPFHFIIYLVIFIYMYLFIYEVSVYLFISDSFVIFIFVPAVLGWDSCGLRERHDGERSGLDNHHGGRDAGTL